MSPQETLSPVVTGAKAQATAAATPETRAATESDAPIATQVLAADDTLDDDNDSAIGGDSLSSTASIASSIYKFRVENGRTYNGYGDRRYFMPNDEVEQDRLDLQHHLFQLTFRGGMFTAPIDRKKVHRILDAGTGTGIWAIDMGDMCPEAEVFGVDVSPIQPQFVPPNVKFEIDDLEKPWTFTSGFDFVFSRMMTGSFPDWRQYINHCYEFTNPGGYCEVQDVCLPVRCDDDTLTNTNLERYGNLMLEGSLKLGVGLDVALKTKQCMEEAGFVDVNQVTYKWPLNRWPANKAMKEIGILSLALLVIFEIWQLASVESSESPCAEKMDFDSTGLWAHEVTMSNLSGLSIALFTHGLGWSVEELEVFLADVRKDLKNSKIHSYMPIYVVVGRKPGAKEETTVVA